MKRVLLAVLALLLLAAGFVGWRWSQFQETQTLREADARRAPIAARRIETAPPLAPINGCITGLVRDGAAPVGGAQVSVSTSPPAVSPDCPCVSGLRNTCTCIEGLEQVAAQPPLAMLEAVQSVTSAPDGTFSLCGLTDTAPRLVWAEHVDGRVALRSDEPREVSAGASVVLQVLTSREVDGVVLSDDGPVPGATIVSLPLPQVTVSTTTSDTRGRFRTRVFTAESLFVVRAPGFSAQQFRRVAPASGVLVLQLEPLVSLTVRVLRDGRPEPDVAVTTPRSAPVQTNAEGIAVLKVRRAREVEVSARKGLLLAKALVRSPRELTLTLEPGAVLRGTVVDDVGAPLVDALVEIEDVEVPLHTDAAGAFVTEPLPPAQRTVSVSHARCVKTSRFVRPALEPELTLTLRCSATGVGRVVDADGAPVDAAQLVLKTANDVESATTSSDGRFRFFGTGPGVVTVTHRRYRETKQPLTLPTTDETLIVLDGAASITGRVVDARGVGITGANVEVFPVFETLNATIDHPSTRTAAEGRFELHGLGAGRFGLLVNAEGRGRTTGDAFTLQPGEHRDGLEVRLEASVDFSGVVLDEKRRPVPGARVTGSPSEEDAAFVSTLTRYAAGDLSAVSEARSSTATTDADGHFELRGVAATQLTLEVNAVGFAKRRTVVSRGNNLELTLDRLGMARGRVVDASGRPLASFEINGVTFADGSGSFEVRTDSQLRVSARGFVSRTLTLDEPGDHTLGDTTLQRSNPVRVTVKSDSGKPVVAAVRASGAVCRTSDVPWCELTGAADGELEVTVSADAHVPQTRKLSVDERTRGAEFTLRFARGQLSGVASLAPGKPAAGVELNVTGAGTASTVTDINGAFTVAGLDEGASCISLQLPGNIVGEWSTPSRAATPSTPVAVGPVVGGATLEAVGLFRALVAIEGRHDNQPLKAPDAATACRKYGRTVGAAANMGVTRLEGLPPGTWTVWLMSSPDAVEHHVVELVAGETRRF